MEHLYARLADEVEAQIKARTLQIGDRLPSIRSLSETRKVSVSTAQQAYVLLEARGWIEARPQSGFYVKARLEAESPCCPGVSESIVPVEICEIAYSMIRESRDPKTVALGAACPCPSLFPNAALGRLTSKIIRDDPELSGRYEFPPGLESLRSELAKRSLGSGASFRAEDYVITTGAMEALFLSLKAVTKPGDTILVETPIYYGTLQVLESLGLKAAEVACRAVGGTDPVEVRKILAKRKIAAGLFIPNFNNPIGALMPDEAKRELVRIFSEHQIPLIEDDIYGELGFEETRPRSLAAFDKDHWVISVSSFSKTLSPGFRIGWAATRRFAGQIAQLKFSHSVATASLQQHVVSEFLHSGSYDRHLRKIRAAFRTQVNQLREAVLEYFPAATKVTAPEGGFVLWIEVPESIDTVEVYGRALKQKISFSPGVIFSPSKKYRNYLRLNAGLRVDDDVLKSVKQLGRLMRA